MTKLFSELRRRNVIRMAGLYLVGAWLIVQIAETLLPIFHTPDWVLQVLVVLLALGFVPALVFSWIFELTPEGLKRDADVGPGQSITAQTAKRMDQLTLAGVLLLLVVIGLDRYWPQDGSLPEPADPSATGSNELTQKPDASDANRTSASPGSIAVLPFVNMSADKDNEYFSDGISEELLNVLVKVDGLSVASRTSSFAFKGREQSAAAIGAELNVAHVLEGSVRKSGNRVRITAQLIDAASDRHLWSETFDRELTDIFAIQDEIANSIVAELRKTLGNDAAASAVAVRADTHNLDAYQSYLKARELFITRTRLDESVRLFEQAVALDPDFARGWEGLAAVCAVIVDWTNTYPDIDRPAHLIRAEQAAERALTLDPSLSLPWAARSLVASNQLPIDYARSLAMVDRAIEADPRNATALLWRGILWMSLGFIDRGLTDFNGCLALDPAYGNCLRWKSIAVLFLGDSDHALSLYEKGMAAGFNSNRANSFIEPLIRRGNSFAARLLMRELKWPAEVQAAVIGVIAEGKPAPDLAALLERHPGTDRSKYYWGLLLRDYSAAVEDDGITSTFVEHWDPALEGMRESAAFKRILHRMGAPAYWQAHGFPALCRPVTVADFVCGTGIPEGK